MNNLKKLNGNECSITKGTKTLLILAVFVKLLHRKFRRFRLILDSSDNSLQKRRLRPSADFLPAAFKEVCIQYDPQDWLLSNARAMETTVDPD